jgi:glutathione S-transferase
MSGCALPVFYSFRRCPYAMRARLALAASGQRCELREVVLRDKPAALLKASAKGTVPVLVDTDGTVIDESLDIMLWALRRNDPCHWLQPEHGGLDLACSLVRHNDGPFKQQLDRYKYPSRFMLDSGLPSREAACEWLFSLNDRLGGSGCLQGSRASLADIAIAPFVRQFAMTDQAWFDAQPWPALRAWLQAFLASRLFQSVMLKFEPWKDNSPGVDFPQGCD